MVIGIVQVHTMYDYKYYIRRTTQDGSTRTSMTVNVSNKTLVNWNSAELKFLLEKD